MNKILKKFTAVVLTALIMMSLVSVAFAGYKEYPTIYITGAQTNKIYDEQGNHVSDFDVDLEEAFSDSLKPLLTEFAIGMLTDDYKKWAEHFATEFIAIYEKSALDKKGEASNGTHPEHHSSTVSVSEKKSGYGMWDYRFWYDWRLSPMVTCQELKAYIDRVLEATGATKVNLVGRCYGANVIAAYVEMNKDHAESYVDDIGYFAPSIEGIDFMTALFTGEIYLDPDALENFADWYIENEGLIEQDAVAGLVIALLELFNQVKVLGFTADALDILVDRVKGEVIPLVLRGTFATWTSYFAMLTEGTFEKAMDFIFGGVEDEYAGCIEKASDYYYNVQLKHDATMKEMLGRGVGYNVFVKYNFPEYPIYKGASAQSDGDTLVYRQSFGATAADFGKRLSEDYVSSLSDKKYLSGDFIIDASTCKLPENTWFVKNLHHNHWAAMEGMALDIMNNDYNVSDMPAGYQFRDNANNMQPVTPDEEITTKPDNPFASLIRFLSAFFDFIAGLFRGEISFKK